MALSRREFLVRAAGVPGLLAARPAGWPARAGAVPRSTLSRQALGFPVPGIQWRGDSSVTSALRAGDVRAIARAPIAPLASFDWDAVGEGLRGRFRDLRRHVVFEYYPWYRTSPWQHWNQDDRVPPVDVASNYMPLLGPYDSTDAAAVERHAEWIAASGAGAVNVSWWGPGSDTDRAVPLIMDVMRAHDIHVTFHLEPYTDRRADVYARDVFYLLEEYGRKRRWDCFLLPEDASGRSGPVFKSFRTIVPETSTDCHGVTHVVPDHTPASAWRLATDTVRERLRGEFDHVTLLADSLDFGETPAGGFDGIAIYDNYVEPPLWRGFATECTARGLVYSFNVNPGFDGIVARHVEPGSCYRPPRIVPDGDALDWHSGAGRTKGVLLSKGRIRDSLQTTVGLQTDAALGNAKKGFFLVYVNSFNEWHEGHQFEPMKSYSDLRPDERAIGYHNAFRGGYRMDLLRGYLQRLVG